MQSSKEQQGEIRKPFLSEQCKEIEGNNRVEKTRDLFKKNRDTKVTFHAKWTKQSQTINVYAPHSRSSKYMKQSDKITAQHFDSFYKVKQI